MRKVIQSILILTLSITLILVSHGYSWAQEPKNIRVIQETTERKPISAQEDNAFFLEHLTTGLIVTLRVSDQDISLVRSQIGTVPKVKPKEVAPHTISLIGIRGKDVVTRTAVPDEELVVQENKGLIRVPVRMITAVLPTSVPIDKLKVHIKPHLQKEFDLGPLFKEFCNKYPKDPICIHKP